MGPEVASFVVVSAPKVVLRHVNIIDGTGAMPRPDQTVILTEGRVAVIGPATTTPVPDGAEVHDYAGYSVLPGLVGMHDHLFYSASNALQRGAGSILEPGVLVAEIAFTAPRLYLAAGVTTLRTTGSIEPYTDIKVQSRIEAGLMPGPTIYLTSPYLEGAPTQFAQMHEVANADEAQVREPMGGRGHDLIQGVHAHHARRTRSGRGRSAPPWPKDHRAPVFGQLARGDRKRDRQS
jgi:imidazolonepropionase-like amidohydrolase